MLITSKFHSYHYPPLLLNCHDLYATKTDWKECIQIKDSSLFIFLRKKNSGENNCN